MTQDEIIEMAKEVGLGFVVDRHWMCHDELEAFAKLVAAKEREACAKIVEESSLPDAYSEPCLLVIAEEIRARGET
jgi:hypothetical protein